MATLPASARYCGQPKVASEHDRVLSELRSAIEIVRGEIVRASAMLTRIETDLRAIEAPQHGVVHEREPWRGEARHI